MSRPDDTGTRRMQGGSKPPPDDATRRMDTRGVPTPARNQNDTPTRHIDTAAAPPPSSSSGWTSVKPAGMPLGALEPGTVLCGDCVVVRTHHNHESERPGLFECTAPEGRVMVKIAATEYPPQPELWRRLSELNHRHVLRIFRTHEEDGRFYEVQEYCTGGTIESYVPSGGSGRPVPPLDWIEKSLVRSFRLGISYLHARDIVHRDIKPSNLYLREENGQKTLVIGDFDISSILQIGRTSRSTDRAAGTWIYSAPEAFPRFIDEGGSKLGAAVVRSSDYYSFGVVIVELLLGTTSLHQAKLPDLYDFYLQGGRVEIPAGLPPRFTELLSGLLCRNRQRRWGSDEVARWMAGKTSEEDRRRIAEDRGYVLGQAVPPFTAFDSSKPTSLIELSQAMAREPKIALDELMSGDVMLNWIGQIDARVARLVRQAREKWAAQPRLALLNARLHLDPAAGLPADTEGRFHTAEDWARWAEKAVAGGRATAQSLCDPEGLAELETWLRLKQAPEPEAADRLAYLTKLYDAPAGPTKTPRNPRLIFEALFWAFRPQRPFFVAQGLQAQTPKEIAALALGEPDAWDQGVPNHYTAVFRRWQEGYLEAYLRERLTGHATSPLLAQMTKIRNDFAGKPLVAFEITLRLLDPEVAPVDIVFDMDVFNDLLEAAYGEQATLSIPWSTSGAGIPYAALHLQNQYPGLTLFQHEINEREGEITVQLDSHNDIPVGREYKAFLVLAGDYTRHVGQDPIIRYRVTHPVIDSLLKIVAGAAIGAVIMGGARAALTTLVPQAISLNDATLLARPTGGVILGVLVLVFFLAWQIWMWALANLAR